MSDRFDKFMHIIIWKHEGGDKITTDKGGITKYGIAQRYNPEVDVKSLTEDKAIAIYRKKYYEPSGASKVVNDELSFTVLDCAINPGIGWISRTIQRLVGVEVDGKVGAKTLEAVNNHDPKTLVELIRKERANRYVSIAKKDPSQLKCLKGWLNRTNYEYKG